MDRKKILLGLLAVVGLGFGGDWAYRNWVEDPFRKQEIEQTKFEKSLADVQDQTVRAKILVRDLAEYEDRSLPANPVLARQSYQAWCWQLLKRHDITNPSVDVSQPRPRSMTKSNKKDSPPDLYELGVTIRGVAALSVVIDLLAEFQQTTFLHRIDGVNLTPLNQGRSLSFTISVSALALRTATEADRLPGQLPVNPILADTDNPRENVEGPTESSGETLVSVPTQASSSSGNDDTSVEPNRPNDSVVAVDSGSIPRQVDETQPIVRNPSETAIVERPWQEIVKRNMFAAGGGMSVAKTLKLSAVTEDIHGVKQAWFRTTTPGPAQIVEQGKTMTHGSLSVRVVEVTEDHAILLIDGDRVRVHIGQVIADGIALVQTR